MLLTFEIVVFLGILGVLGLACHAGRIALKQMTFVLSEFNTLIADSAEHTKQMAVAHAHHLRSFGDVTRQAMTDTVQSHAKLLSRVSDAHERGANLLSESTNDTVAASASLASAAARLADATKALQAGAQSLIDDVHKLTAHMVPKHSN
jgi:hypothetical protein